LGSEKLLALLVRSPSPLRAHSAVLKAPSAYPEAASGMHPFVLARERPQQLTVELFAPLFRMV
jgi:hypothetical protein